MLKISIYLGKFTLSNIKAISSGYFHTCALTEEKSVKCWGFGGYGRLGNGETNDASTPVDVHTSSSDDGLLSGIAAISSGSSHTCALTEEGHVKCWGHGVYGQLGNRRMENDHTPTPIDVHTNSSNSIPLSGIKAISSGYYHTCALTKKGLVKCWGRGSHGRLGDGRAINAPTPVNVHTNSSESTPLSEIVAISSGGYHTCALTNKGNVKCWGYGSSGQLGHGKTSDAPTPVDVLTNSSESTPLSGIVAISSGAQNTCALTNKGNVKCWGFGENGQLGHGEMASVPTPVDVLTSSSDATPLGSIKAIAPGFYHTCALTKEGSAKCWGLGDNGQLGHGRTPTPASSIYSTTPVNVHTSASESAPLSNLKAMSSGGYHTCALAERGNVKCWGLGDNGQLGHGKTATYSSTPVDVIDDSQWTVLSISEGRASADDFQIASYLNLKSTDSDSRFTLRGRCDVDSSGVRVFGDILDNPEISCSKYGTFNIGVTLSEGVESKNIILKQYDTHNGDDDNDDDDNIKINEIAVNVDLIKKPQDIEMLSSGNSHTCILKKEGLVKCWGYGVYGQLGHGRNSISTTPVDVHTNSKDNSALNGIKVISSGYHHTCALTEEGGHVKCWGSGTYGRLGNGQMTAHSNTPIDVHTSSSNTTPLKGIKAISSGGYHTCALTEEGGYIKCWGYAFYGQLGHGGTSTSTTPVDVLTGPSDSTPLSGITALSSGVSHTCALTKEGLVKCWGRGDDGQLGNGETNTNTTTPVDVHTNDLDKTPLGGIKAISSGGYHTCALTERGNVKCWGYGVYGQLGHGGTSTSTTPVDVHTNSKDNSRLDGITAMSSGNHHTCALTKRGFLKCWGRGTYGRLGNGESIAMSTTPVDVHTSSSDGTPLSGIKAISSGGHHSCLLLSAQGGGEGLTKCWGRGDQGQLGNGKRANSNTPVDVLDTLGKIRP